jgi:Flp pilus assembly protein TadD
MTRSLSVVLAGLLLLLGGGCQRSSSAGGPLFQEHMGRGKHLFDQGNYSRANIAFQRARSLDPTSEEAVARLDLSAVALAAASPDVITDGNINELDYTLDVLTDRAPEHAHLLFTARGNLMARAGQRAQAVAAYRLALERRADFPPALFFMAQVLDQAGQAGEAEAAMRTLVKVDPKHVSGRETLAALLSRRGAHDEATQVLHDGLTLAGDARLHAALGAVAAKAGRSQDAESAYREALKVDPDSPVALYGLAALLLPAQRLAEARSLLSRYLEVASARGEPPQRITEVREALPSLPLAQAPPAPSVGSVPAQAPLPTPRAP